MAYIKKNEEEEEKQLPLGEPIMKTEGGGVMLGSQQAEGAPPTNLSPQKAGTTGFTDVSAYLQANRPVTQSVAERIAGRLGEEATATREKIKQAETTIGEKVGAGKTVKDEALLARAIETPTEVAKNPEDLAKIKAMREATYKGPATAEELEPYELARQAVTESERKAGLVETPQGRKELLYGMAKSPTRGQMTLDELLLSQDPRAREILAGGAASFKDLKDYLGTVRTGGTEAIKRAQEETEATRTGTSTSLQDAITKSKTNLAERVGTARGTATTRAEAAKAALATGDFSPEVMADLGITPEQSQKLKLALTELQQYGMPLDLSKYVTQQSPEAQILESTYATPEDYARSAALAELAGVPQGYLNPAEAGLAGTANLDVTDFDAMKAVAEGSDKLSAKDKELIIKFADAFGNRDKLTAAELAQIDEAMAREPKTALLAPIASVGEKTADMISQIPAVTKEFAKDLAKKAGQDALKKIANAPKNLVKSIGKGVKKIFCFDKYTPIMMADGTDKPIGEIELGDRVFKGGEVYSIRRAVVDPADKFNYHNIIVTGEHAVKDGGLWKRIKDCKDALKFYVEGDVYSICTTNHRIWIKGFEFADELETEDYEHLTIEESLDALNRQNATIIEYSEVK